MKFTAIFLFSVCMTAAASGFSQKVTLYAKEASLEKVFNEIKRQTGYRFLYLEDVLVQSRPVTIELEQAGLEEALYKCFYNQPLTYEIIEKTIIVKLKAKTGPGKLTPPAPAISFMGKVVNEEGEPMARVTIQVKGTGKGTITGADGGFAMEVNPGDVLEISFVGYETQTVKANEAASPVTIVLKVRDNRLDETVVMAYGKVTRRLNTGNITRVSAADISRQPASNPLAVLQGRVPGLFVEQSNGIPGSNFSLLVRGQNSLKQGTQPMIIIDGVPLTLNSGAVAQLGYTANQNVLNLVNPADLESIEVLTDADATAIYGSQGANGVILLTTKKGARGPVKMDVNVYLGMGKITRPIELLNTRQYIQMRKEAFANDAVQPDISTAPDLLLWDTTRYTDWQDMLIGNTAHVGNYQASISGGNAQTNFLLSGNYYRESTVFPGDQPFTRGTGKLMVNHQSTDKRFSSTLGVFYSADQKRFPITDLTNRIYLPPNTPAAIDANGNLDWNDWPNSLDNPIAYQRQQYKSNFDQWIANASFHYSLFKGFQLKASGGYSFLSLDEVATLPIISQRPSAGPTGSLALAGNQSKSWIVEAQATYIRQWKQHKMELLAGSSLQQRRQQNESIQGTGYTNDDLLGSISAAPALSASSGTILFRYQAAYGRINYRFQDRYVVNLNFRRDASSRFGPANRFANFGALGVAWIFSDETFFKDKIAIFSFGKLRSSYGITGNDQIGDYRFIDSWSSNTNYQYQGTAGVLPTRFFNPYLEWERNKKFEVALELGFFRDRLLLNTTYYVSRSDNQLVNYKLPSLTGFNSITQNLDAIIQNNGVEWQLTYSNARSSRLYSSTSFNISVPKTKLVDYPNLATSSDNNNYIVGKPLTMVRLYHYTGVSAQTGIYQFEDVNNDGTITPGADMVFPSFILRKFYGGLQQSFQWRNWELDLFVFFAKQNGRDYTYSMINVPGTMNNQPSAVLDSWTASHQQGATQRFSTTVTNPAYAAYGYYRNSDASVTDASFLRLKNVYLAYRFPSKFLQKIKTDKAKLYLQAQNLVTLTRYKAGDPETRSALSLPPLKMFTIGLQFTF